MIAPLSIILVLLLPLTATAVRVMPFGDSITGMPGCWRALLWTRFLSDGVQNLDFVGTLPATQCNTAHDGDHEGHSGFQAVNIAAQNQLVGWLATTSPEVVLMHLGTNDMWGGRSVSEILGAYTTLVAQMRQKNASMKIIVMQIIPMNLSFCSDCSTKIVQLNQQIPAWAAGQNTTASPIMVVDQYTGFSATADTSDGIHPNAVGEKKIADRLYPVLRPWV